MTANVATFNISLMQVNSMIEAIDVAISDAYTIGIENYNRSKELGVNASQLCTAANTMEQVNQHLSTHYIVIYSTL